MLIYDHTNRITENSHFCINVFEFIKCGSISVYERKRGHFLFVRNADYLPGWLNLEPLKDLWVEQREHHHLLQS